MVSYFLKTAHLATLRASTILKNRNGKNKPPAPALDKLNADLFSIRNELDCKLYEDFFQSTEEQKLLQRYFGPLDRKLKLMFQGKNIFF